MLFFFGIVVETGVETEYIIRIACKYIYILYIYIRIFTVYTCIYYIHAYSNIDVFSDTYICICSLYVLTYISQKGLHKLLGSVHMLDPFNNWVPVHGLQDVPRADTNGVTWDPYKSPYGNGFFTWFFFMFF